VRGTRLRVRGGAQFVTIYTLAHEPVFTHDRAQQAGARVTHPEHLPPEKAPGLTVSREGCQAAAHAIGPATTEVVTTLLADPAVDRLRTAGRLVRLGEHYSASSLEAACARAVQFAEPSYATVKRILVGGLDQAAAPAPARTPPARTFARSAVELLGHLFGGAAWN